MSITQCPICRAKHRWSWEEAFDKFGFDDGDGIVMTDVVANALRQRGYTVTAEPWGSHNVIIGSIRTKKGNELIPENTNIGYDDPRSYLPKRIIKLLDEAFPGHMQVMP
jgi:hypothetical protein